MNVLSWLGIGLGCAHLTLDLVKFIYQVAQDQKNKK